MGSHTKQLLRRVGANLVLLLAFQLQAVAGSFGVSPIRIDLDRSARNGAIAVTNDEDGAPLRTQLRLYEWTQDASGKDEYRESEDLLYFPRLMALEKGEQKLVRVGLRVPATTQEKTYRLFIEELPSPPPPGAAPGARVAIAVRFGVPVFVKPMNEDIRGVIEKLELTKGSLRVVVRNAGNVHFTINAIAIASGDAHVKEVSGWYLLAGAMREHAIELPAETCGGLKRLDVTVKTDKSEFKDALDVNASMCKR
ncbi:MAG: fimbria/pilus periplasmic chaperone [Sulfuritalea sp.]|nr:fimbria/pilus periplasmic chaperone [Sulfuritalea sp.]MDP1983082.1 fimbria/pilus periplasmic chaperone [Sulfuritalea sp.]